jgi:hypothetical protein
MKQILLLPLLLLTPLLLVTPAIHNGHDDYTQSKGCESANMAAYWLNNVCHHQPPASAVATTTFHCHNGKCESGGWVPIR